MSDTCMSDIAGADMKADGSCRCESAAENGPGAGGFFFFFPPSSQIFYFSSFYKGSLSRICSRISSVGIPLSMTEM